MGILEQKIVRIGSLNLTYAYLNEDAERRKEMCHTILEQAFGHMRAAATIDTKAEAMSNLLIRSIKVLEQEEIYEEAQIILELQKQIPNVVEKMKSQSAQ